MLKKVLFICLLFIYNLEAGNINIAVAANVSYAMPELKKEFNKLYPTTNVRVTLGGSGKLTAQISNGAPYMLFMSADMKYPEALYKSDYAITKPLVYAQGALAVFSSKQRVWTKGLKVLNSMLVKRVAIANPKTAPYGKATFEALKNLGILQSVKPKMIYAESISQTVSYVMMAADVGVIAKSSLYSKKMKRFHKNVHWVEVNKKLYTPIKQGIVILKEGKDNSEVKAFYEFMKSKRAKDILKRYGYIVS